MAVSAPALASPAAVAPAPIPHSRRVRRPGLGARLAFWALVFGLLALNGWWAWEELRPVPELREATALFARGRHAEADSAFRLRLRRSPNDGESRTGLARSLAARGDWAGCARELALVPFWWPTKGDALILEGQAWMKSDRAARAEAAWLEYLDEDPNHPGSRPKAGAVESELINLYASEDRWDEARALVWKSFERTPPEARGELLLMLMRTRMEVSDPAVAIVTLRRYAEADPTDWEARRALARFAQTLNRPEEADRHIRACLEALPRDPRVWRDWLTILLARDDHPALAVASMMIPAEGDSDGRLWKLRGLARERLDRLDDIPAAEAAYLRSIALEPNDFETYHRLNLVERRLGRPERAVEFRAKFQLYQSTLDTLKDTLTGYVAAVEADPPRPAAVRAIVQKVAEMTRTLGWTRESDAWAAMLGRGTTR